jgi:hypothetical protein
MTAKRISRRQHPTNPDATAPTQDLTDEAVVKVLESAGTVSTDATNVDPSLRRQMVAAAAYFIAERRGFAPGHELEDWVAAEAAVDSRLHPMRAA